MKALASCIYTIYRLYCTLYLHMLLLHIHMYIRVHVSARFMHIHHLQIILHTLFTYAFLYIYILCTCKRSLHAYTPFTDYIAHFIYIFCFYIYICTLCVHVSACLIDNLDLHTHINTLYLHTLVNSLKEPTFYTYSQSQVICKHSFHIYVNSVYM
jgi:hypothetical protein